MIRRDILVAGIGNIFLGDDAFGVEVVRKLAMLPMADRVHVEDFGIRGFDLAFALDTAETILLVDTVARGGVPGTLYTIEPDMDDLDDAAPDAHAMGPTQVLRLARQLNVTPGRILLIGCEPATFGPENEGVMGLSPFVEAAVDRAVELIESMISRMLRPQMAQTAGTTV
ncbi:MAG TPA: hydrogenase maturation protease [Bryobacteraceae bacterium]|jgi:hydrogenase maturation protease